MLFFSITKKFIETYFTRTFRIKSLWAENYCKWNKDNCWHLKQYGNSWKQWKMMFILHSHLKNVHNWCFLWRGTHKQLICAHCWIVIMYISLMYIYLNTVFLNVCEKTVIIQFSYHNFKTIIYMTVQEFINIQSLT